MIKFQEKVTAAGFSNYPEVSRNERRMRLYKNTKVVGLLMKRG
jgi:hypothetical protein